VVITLMTKEGGGEATPTVETVAVGTVAPGASVVIDGSGIEDVTGHQKSSSSSFSGNTVSTLHTKVRHYRAKIVGLEVVVSAGEDVLFSGKWAER
jgi:hypothetical protein